MTTTRRATSGRKTATFEVDPGEDVTCVFTNQKRSLLIVRKETNPKGAGGDQAFDFEADYGDFSLQEGEQHGAPLPAGTYSVEENVPDGWELESATCNNGSTPDARRAARRHRRDVHLRQRPGTPDLGTIIVEKTTVPSGDETEFDFLLRSDGVQPLRRRERDVRRSCRGHVLGRPRTRRRGGT